MPNTTPTPQHRITSSFCPCLYLLPLLFCICHTIPVVLSFTPLIDTASYISSTATQCSSTFYPSFPSGARLVVFDNNRGPSFGDGGTVGLSGGIETAIDPHLCRRMTHINDPTSSSSSSWWWPSSSSASNQKKFDQKCAQLIKAIQRAASMWTDRHPTLYFNFTDPIYDTSRAELIITSSWDDFGDKPTSPGTALAFARRIGKQKEADVASTFVRSSSSTSSSTSSTFSSSPAKPKTFPAIVSRHEIVLNPFTCFFASESIERRCTTTGRKAALGLGVCILIAVLCALVCICVLFLQCKELYQAPQQRKKRDEELAASEQELEVWNLAMANDARMFAEHGMDEDTVEEIVASRRALFHSAVPVRAPIPSTKQLISRMSIPILLLILSILAMYGCVRSYKGLSTTCENVDVATALNNAQAYHPRCFRLEEILAHEIGHVLGLGHPDQTFHLLPEDKKIAKSARKNPDNTFVPLSGDNPCRGLALERSSSVDCRTITDIPHCKSQSHCRVGIHPEARVSFCESVYTDVLMYSAVEGKHHLDAPRRSVRNLTEDDLAALFFLYPTKVRSEEWKTAPIPLRDYSINKLKALSEDFFGGTCSTLAAEKADLVECLMEEKVKRGIEALNLLRDHACETEDTILAGGTKRDSSSPCTSISGLSRSALDALAGIKSLRRHRTGGRGNNAAGTKTASKKEEEEDTPVAETKPKASPPLSPSSSSSSASESSAASRAAAHVSQAQSSAEAALPDEIVLTPTTIDPVDYSPTIILETVIDTVIAVIASAEVLSGTSHVDGVGNDAGGDANSDGVSDNDRDCDGLPDEAEDGLDVLRDILGDIAEGRYHGRWDADGDGVENGKDEDFQGERAGGGSAWHYDDDEHHVHHHHDYTEHDDADASASTAEVTVDASTGFVH